MNHHDITARHAAIIAQLGRTEAERWAKVAGLLAVGLLIMVACVLIIIN